MEIHKGSILNILDIDLDFFLNHKHTGYAAPKKRLDGNFYKPWDENQTRNFLELNCGLSTTNRVPGVYCIEHVEVFYHLRKWQEQHDFSLRVLLDHVDAHADLGTGDASYRYISEEILQMEVKKRAYPKEKGGWEKLSSGNFLAFAIACRWVNRLRYINDEDEMDDCQWFHLKNFEIDSDIIQLKRYSKEQMDRIISGIDGGMHETATNTKPLELEPEIPFFKVDYRKFTADLPYDFIFLTQSPGYTPVSSDTLIPVIQSYMEIVD